MILAGICLLFVGLYLVLQRSTTKIILGLILVGNAVNFSIFLGSNPEFAMPAFIVQDSLTLESSNDPVPQALVLTAIVISFALVSFTVAIGKQLKQLGIEDTTAMNEEA